MREGVGKYGCHFDGLDELDTMKRERERQKKGGREGGREGRGEGGTYRNIIPKPVVVRLYRLV